MFADSMTQLGLAKKMLLAAVLPAGIVVSILDAPAIQAHPQFAATEHPAFDVVSIKRNNSGVTWSLGSPIKDKVGRYSARNVTLRSLISWFYGVYESQVVGGPRWLDSERFDIDAEVDGHPSQKELIHMLQALLADRFRLQIHSESQERTRYVLVPPKNGLKFGMHLMKADGRDCPSDPPGSPGCRAAVIGPQSLAMEHINFAVLARTLSSMLGVVVIDETGLAGRYDIKLDFDSSPSETGAALSYGDSVVTALREQTGLRLESRKGPTQVLAIDRAEKPTDN